MAKKHTHKHMYSSASSGSAEAGPPLGSEIEPGEIAVNTLPANPSLFIKDCNGEVRKFCDEKRYTPHLQIGMAKLIHNTATLGVVNPVYVFGSQYSSYGEYYYDVSIYLKGSGMSAAWEFWLGGECGDAVILTSDVADPITDMTLVIECVKHIDQKRWFVTLSGKIVRASGTEMGIFFSEPEMFLGYDLKLEFPQSQVLNGGYIRAFTKKRGYTVPLESPIVRPHQVF